MPCVVLDTQDWSDNFDSKYFHKVNLKDAGNKIKELYGTAQVQGALDYVCKLDNDVAKKWIEFLDNFVSKKSNTNAAKINTYETICYKDYIKDLERSHLAREDFESVLSNRHKFLHVVYTDNNTYLSKVPTFKPVEEEVGIDLFNFA
jgi:hypothetical protein